MTEIVLKNTQQEPKLVKIEEAVVGKWYKVHSYKHGTQFKGEIGVLCNIFWDSLEETTPSFITPDGRILNDPDFILQELESVEITYR